MPEVVRLRDCTSINNSEYFKYCPLKDRKIAVNECLSCLERSCDAFHICVIHDVSDNERYLKLRSSLEKALSKQTHVVFVTIGNDKALKNYITVKNCEQVCILSPNALLSATKYIANQNKGAILIAGKTEFIEETIQKIVVINNDVVRKENLKIKKININ